MYGLYQNVVGLLPLLPPLFRGNGLTDYQTKSVAIPPDWLSLAAARLILTTDIDDTITEIVRAGFGAGRA